MPSLLEALEEKYGLASDENHNELSVCIFVPKLPPRLIVPELLVLNDCDIDKAGEPEDLRQKCYPVKELDLAQNKLHNWSEVFTILSHMPHVEFVNLSLNRLSGPVNPPVEYGMSNLRSLVLNNTGLDWDSVETIINLLPKLEELHLSLNDYENVLIDTIDDDNNFSYVDELISETDTNVIKSNLCRFDETNVDPILKSNPPSAATMSTSSTQKPAANRSISVSSTFKKTNAHEGVKKLHFTGNPVSEWSEICRLGRVFPKLESLVLAECAIKSIDPSPTLTDANECNSVNSDNENSPHTYFRNLALLNLSNTNINAWDNIDRLAKFPALRNLRVQNWPLWEKCESTEHERRQLLIARLPHVQTLNGGGIIGLVEREDAERAFIRYYLDKPENDRPERYSELIKIHGKIDPLVNIDLRPEKRVKVKFTYGDTSEVRSVDVYRTVIDLKSRLERIVNITTAKMRLFYVDQDLRDHQGPEEMKYPHKQLYSYNISNGDEIIIDEKR